MVSFKTKFICIIFLISGTVFAGKKQCGILGGEIKRIQKKQTKFKAFGFTVGSLQKSFDENMAKLILLKGLKEIKDDFWRSKEKIKLTEVEKGKVQELQKKLEDGIDASSKLLAMTDLLEGMDGKKPSSNSAKFLNNLKKDCKKSSSELCDDLKRDNSRHASMVRGFSTSLKISGEDSIKDLEEDFKEGLPTKDQIKNELDLERDIQKDIARLNRCLEKGETCKPELSLIKEKVKDMNQALSEYEGLNENKKRLALEDSFGDLKTYVDAIEIKRIKESKGLDKKQEKNLKELNKRIKKNFEVANIRRKIRGGKYNPNEPPEVTEKNAKRIYKDFFKKLDCHKLVRCLEKLGPGTSTLEKEIGKIEDKVDDAKVNLDKISQDEDYKNLSEMKALLVSMAADECRDLKTSKGHPGFITCDFDDSKISPHYKVNKFAFQIGRVMAEVDKDLFIDESTPKLEKEKKLKKLCKKDYKLRAKKGQSSSLCYSLYPELKKGKTRRTISKKFNNLFLSDEEKILKKCGPARRCMDWAAFYERYDVTRDETGKGVAVQKIPSWSELIAPQLAKSVTTLLPVGLEMYTSDHYLKEMQNQAAHQMEVNVYRERYPVRTWLWDRGHRGFTDGYVGGPTPENPGVVGHGALGNPYQGVGDWNPFGLSGALSGTMGLYNFNPYYYGNFQYGNTFSYQQLQY